ncbi:WcbI family polysaccharide biosynthesis putative acetyltransferase [Mycolicibacterium sp. BiH015]|uniref:WcbI family polysaccharide biosynthesis putative acetyltransferase n=1 Tax=Mycolicibacterium sp. BiH015 TaxID=3018808 RepID=UPI0022E8E3FA|nr:WcbI family polysaccharide biosynthesis putative acetyltransferase [Mycolicibacterium sp. BiH015]MDA2893821.1 WcbI family polysaccharide biosynthesis putative acetyltransferase [Mycolicibacterium sp. BiH015]
MNSDTGRRKHYAAFYGEDAAPPDDRPLWLVVGNCQAEALRQVLDAVPDRPYRTVRMPPVHEIGRRDLPYLDTLLATSTMLLSQPIRAGYRDLPLGTSQLAERLSPSATCIRWPVIRYAGLYPFQAIVRHPADRSVVPPVVPYHDLRTVAAARAGLSPTGVWDVDVTDVQLRAAAQASRAELERRERRDCDVGISDVLEQCGAEAAHTINHPGNPVLEALGRRVLDAGGLRLPVPTISRTLLDSVHAPLEPRVLTALALDAAPRGHWVHDGARLSVDSVHGAQLNWYAANPDFVELAMARHAEMMDILGLLTVSAAS